MIKYRLSRTAEEDLIRIYKFGEEKFGKIQAEKYYDVLFEYFELISENPYSFEAVDFIASGYRRIVCGSNSIFHRIGEDKMVEIMTIIGKQDLKGI